MQRLEVDNIEGQSINWYNYCKLHADFVALDLRPALQQMIEKSVEKFMPRATVNALNQN
jgi:hypothetical protein